MMSYNDPKRPSRNVADAKDVIRTNIDADARIWAILADDDAECERTLEFKFTKNESKQIFRFIRDLLNARNGQ